MGYCSNVMIAVTKKDFKKIEDAQKKIPDNTLLDELEIENYKENDIDCVFAHFGYIKYYKEYEEVKVLEKTLSKLKDGYIFCRLGEESADIEFRNRTKLPELMKHFDFIIDIRDNLNRELKEEEEEEFE